MGSQRKLDKRIAAFQKRDPSFDADEFLAFAVGVVWQIHVAMGTQQYEQAKDLIVDGANGVVNVRGTFASPPTSIADAELVDVIATDSGDQADIRAVVPTEKVAGVEELWTFVRTGGPAGPWKVKRVEGPKKSWLSEHKAPSRSSSGLAGDD